MSVYFVGTYKPIKCGIADYTSFITRESPAGRWSVLSFDLDKYETPLTGSDDIRTDRLWYGIPSSNKCSALVILGGLKNLSAKKGTLSYGFNTRITSGGIVKSSLLYLRVGIYPRSCPFTLFATKALKPQVAYWHMLQVLVP